MPKMMEILTRVTGFVARLCMFGDVHLMTGNGAPTDGAAGTGAKLAAPASFYFDYTNGNAYINTGTKAEPSWKAISHA